MENLFKGIMGWTALCLPLIMWRFTMEIIIYKTRPKEREEIEKGSISWAIGCLLLIVSYFWEKNGGSSSGSISAATAFCLLSSIYLFIRICVGICWNYRNWFREIVCGGVTLGVLSIIVYMFDIITK